MDKHQPGTWRILATKYHSAKRTRAHRSRIVPYRQPRSYLSPCLNVAEQISQLNMQYLVKCKHDRPNISRAQLCSPAVYPRIVDMSASTISNVKPGACTEITRKIKKLTSEICIDRFYLVDRIHLAYFDGHGCAISEVSSS